MTGSLCYVDEGDGIVESRLIRYLTSATFPRDPNGPFIAVVNTTVHDNVIPLAKKPAPDALSRHPDWRAFFMKREEIL